jgi:hypothetical protein
MRRAPIVLSKTFGVGTATTRDPRAQDERKRAAQRLSPIKMVLPVVLTVVLGSITYVVYSRYKVENEVCVDCNVQRQIINQVYFGQKRDDSEVPRF